MSDGRSIRLPSAKLAQLREPGRNGPAVTRSPRVGRGGSNPPLCTRVPACANWNSGMPLKQMFESSNLSAGTRFLMNKIVLAECLDLPLCKFDR